MIKDTAQKLKAVRYCVSTGLVPFMEVRIRYAFEGAKTPSDITDLDVLGIRPAGITRPQRSLFDCKTQAKMSAINRALWAQGAKSLAGCEEAFVILSRAAPEPHRLAADSLGVRLFHEPLFDEYAASTSPDYKIEQSYLCDAKRWEDLKSISKRFPRLDRFGEFLLLEAPTQGRGTVALRGLMSSLRRARGELDPDNPFHRALFGLALSQLLLSCAELVMRFHTAFDKSLTKAEFEECLRYFIWDGRDNYEVRRKLSDALRANRGDDAGDAFELPGWDAFIEMFRSYLDAPLMVGTTALPCKELAFRGMGAIDTNSDSRLAKRLAANGRVRQFIQFGATYLANAVQLPREFPDGLLESVKTALSKSG